MRRWAIIGVVVGLLLVLVVHRSELATKSDLAKITEIQIVIEGLGPPEREEGLTEDQLKAELMVQLKAKIPRLKVVEKSGDWLYFNVNLSHGKTVGGQKVDYYGSAVLFLHRHVMVLATGTQASAVVWDKGAILTGSLGQAKSRVNQLISEMVTGFAAAYYEAGNP